MRSGEVGYNCKLCQLRGLQNNRRGRDCLLDRDYDLHPVVLRVPGYRGKPGINKDLHSETEFFQAIDEVLELYEVDQVEVALRKMGQGICPRSFPLSRQSEKFLEIFSICHGGQSGLDLLQLPHPGAVMDQPAKLLDAFALIKSEKAQYADDWHQKQQEQTRDTKLQGK